MPRDQITFDDFKKLDIRIGTITSAELITGTDKLVRLEITLGTETRQLVAGIATIADNPNELLGQQVPVLVNLEPKVIRGIESQGMILAVVVNNQPVLLHPENPVPDGSSVS